MVIFMKKFYTILCLKHFTKQIRSLHKEYKVKVNNLKINIVEIGNGEKTALLLPGTLGSAWTNFKPQIEKLPQMLPDFKIIVWDPPGYGKSIPPERSFLLNMFENDAYLAVELMREIRREKFSLLGWSAGGITALIIAGRFPEYIDKLIIWGNGAYITEKEVQHFQDRRDIRQWPLNIRNELQQTYDEKRLAFMWSSWVDLLKKFHLEKEGDFCKADVKCIQAPTFILRGRKDPIISAEHVPFLLKHIKCTKYHEFPDGGHSVHITNANEFNKLVAQFLLGNENTKSI